MAEPKNKRLSTTDNEANTSKNTTKKQKQFPRSEKAQQEKRERDRQRSKARIYIGGAFPRWTAVKEEKGLRENTDVAVFLLDCCKVEKHPDDSIYVRKCKRELPCDQEIQGNPLMDGDIHSKGGSEFTSNMSHEEGCTGITFDISEITFAPDEDTDEDSNCSNEEEEEDDEADESEEEFDDSDREWEKDALSGYELSEFDRLEKNYSKDQLGNNDSHDEFENKYLKEVHGKVSELCPDCGDFFHGGKIHTCEYKFKPFPCNVCGKRYKDKWALKSHGRIHFCKFCLVPFKTRLDKLAHQTAHSPNERPYSCPDCAMTFSNLRVRNFHLKEHRGPKSVSCPHCDLVFSSAYLVKRHIVVHTGVKLFVCQFCSRSFNQPGHLKSHLRLHTGEKPYQCQHCDKSFNHNVSLKSHVMRYHKGASDSGSRKHKK